MAEYHDEAVGRCFGCGGTIWADHDPCNGLCGYCAEREETGPAGNCEECGRSLWGDEASDLVCDDCAEFVNIERGES